MKRILSALGAALVLAAGYVVTLRPVDVGPLVAVTNERPMESRAVRLPDGGRGYAYPATGPDGGPVLVLTDVAPCVRLAAGMPEASCRRRTPDGGSRTFGTLNRFPASESVGGGCQPVACSVVFGENADEEIE